MPGPAEQWRNRRLRYGWLGRFLQEDGTPSIQDRSQKIGRPVPENGFSTKDTVFDQSQAIALLQALSAD